MNYEKITSFSDDGHGWARVPIAEIRLAALQGLEISHCSFMTEKYVYLEEDCDLTNWINFRQIPEETIRKWKHSRRNGSSHIRNYDRVSMKLLRGLAS
jgi:hypothetical protein